MKTIQWLLGLDSGKLVIAILMIGVSALFLQNKSKDTQMSALNANFRNELLKRDDSCAAEKAKIIQDANRRMEEFLRTILDRSRRAERAVDSTIHYNKRVIDSTKSDVRKAKQLLNEPVP